MENICRAKLVGMAAAAAAAAKSLQSCPTLWDPIDGSPPGSALPGILQARTREWVAISFSNACMWKVKGKSLSRVLLLATPWTTAYQAPPSMGFSRQEHWSGVPVPSPCRYCNLMQMAGLMLRCWKFKSVSRVRLFVTPWTVARQAPLSMEFSRPEYWSG